MDAKKCDRCGRFYEEYGDYSVSNRNFKVKKPSMIRTGTKTVTENFVCEKHFDLCPICMDELNNFLTDPNAFQCLGNCETCEKQNHCKAFKKTTRGENR